MLLDAPRCGSAAASACFGLAGGACECIKPSVRERREKREEERDFPARDDFRQDFGTRRERKNIDFSARAFSARVYIIKREKGAVSSRTKPDSKSFISILTHHHHRNCVLLFCAITYCWAEACVCLAS